MDGESLAVARTNSDHQPPPTQLLTQLFCNLVPQISVAAWICTAVSIYFISYHIVNILVILAAVDHFLHLGRHQKSYEGFYHGFVLNNPLIYFIDLFLLI